LVRSTCQEGPGEYRHGKSRRFGSGPCLAACALRAAKADPGRKFHALMDKVIRSDLLWRTWVAVRGNNGALGIDRSP
jgi:hypothetical protein